MSDVNFTPFYDNMLIKKATGEKKTKSGLYLVNDEHVKDYSEGIVVKVGDGYKLQGGELRPLKAKPGDTILYRKMTEIAVKIDGEDYFIVSEGNVLGAN